MLTLNDCGIQSLENFPHLPALIRLDMVFNTIPGAHLNYLRGSRHIQTLMLGANRVEKIEELQPLKHFHQLLQLDLINNPICKLPGYRAQVFTLFPSLSILDTLDKGGKDAYTNQSMLEAVARIPDSLFDKSVPPPPVPAPAHVAAHKDQKSKLSKALKRAGSLDSIAARPIVVSKAKVDRGKYGKMAKISSGRSKAARAGLLFPVGRIKRQLKGVMVGQRIGGTSAVYLAATLEYLTA